MRPGFPRHPKARLAAHLLGTGIAQLVGCMELIWSTAYENGDPIIGDARQLELVAEWPGTPGALVAALLECGGPGRQGLIERTEDGRLQVHDLFDHAPDYVRKRAQREAQRRQTGKTLSDVRRDAVNARWDKEKHHQQQPETQAEPDSSVIQTDTSVRHLNTNGRTPAPAPAPKYKYPPNPPRGGTGGGEAKPPEPEPEEPPGFRKFWLEYPNPLGRKGDRRNCRKLWVKMKLEPKADQILRALATAKRSPAWAKEGGAYIPGPHPFLCKSKWEGFLEPQIPFGSGAAQPRSRMVAETAVYE